MVKIEKAEPGSPAEFVVIENGQNIAYFDTVENAQVWLDHDMPGEWAAFKLYHDRYEWHVIGGRVHLWDKLCPVVNVSGEVTGTKADFVAYHFDLPPSDEVIPFVGFGSFPQRSYGLCARCYGMAWDRFMKSEGK